jgi:hypothetical protein
MSAPTVTFVIQSNNLGQTGTGGQENMIVVVGDSSSGTPNVPYQSPIPGNFVTQFGWGQGPQLAALLAARTGKTVGFVKTRTTGGYVAGTNTAVWRNSTFTSTSAVTVSGAPYDDYYGKVTVQTGGTVGTAGIILLVSLDYGRSTFQTVNLGTATTYAIPNTGITLNFGAGTLVATDTFNWISFAPAPDAPGVAAAICSLIGKGLDIEDLLVPTPMCAVDVTAAQTDMIGLFNAKQFARLLSNARDVQWGGLCTETEVQWMNSIIANESQTAADRVGIAAGYYNCQSPLDGVNYRRPLLFQAGVRDADVAISVDLAATSNPNGSSNPLAPLGNPILTSSPDGLVYHDEASNPGLDAARFMAATSIPGLPGMYIVNSNLMAAPGSDFNWLQHGHVIDKFCKVLYSFFVLKLSSSVRVNGTTGFILDADANDLEARCQAEVDAEIINPGDASPMPQGVRNVQITRNNNILSTSELLVSGLIIPLAYLKTITITIAFKNPAIQPVGGV